MKSKFKAGQEVWYNNADVSNYIYVMSDGQYALIVSDRLQWEKDIREQISFESQEDQCIEGMLVPLEDLYTSKDEAGIEEEEEYES